MDESEIDRRKIRLDMLRIIDNGIVCIGDNGKTVQIILGSKNG